MVPTGFKRFTAFIRMNTMEHGKHLHFRSLGGRLLICLTKPHF